MDLYLTAKDSVADVVEFAWGLRVHLSPVAFSIGTYNIYWYGIIITLGMVLALIFAFRNIKEFGIDSDKLIDCIIVGTIGAFVCARAYYVIFSPESIRVNYKTFFDIINIRDGGIAIYGGIIGALIFGCLTAKIRKMKISPVLDIAALGFLIGQSVGRWGNFFNREAYGSATDLPWGMTAQGIAKKMGEGVFVHPTFLYESLWCLLVFILLRVYLKHRKFDGEIFLMYIGLYGFERFFVEGLRMDSLMLGKIRISQLVAGLCVVFSVISIILIRSRIKRMDSYKLYRDVVGEHMEKESIKPELSAQESDNDADAEDAEVEKEADGDTRKNDNENIDIK